MPLLPQTLEEHGSFVRSLARSLLADPQGADDLAQDAWVAAMERPPRHAENLRGWFATVVHRLARQARRNAELRSLREAASARPEAQADASEGLVRSEVLRSVFEAVLSLEEPYRETVLLRFYEGLSPSEIAARTGTPIATVRSRQQRALEHLRSRLDREWDGDRKAWCRGLRPLLGAGKHASLGAGGAGGFALGWGALIMGNSKLVLGVVAAVFVSLLLWREVESAAPPARDILVGDGGASAVSAITDASNDRAQPEFEAGDSSRVALPAGDEVEEELWPWPKAKAKLRKMAPFMTREDRAQVSDQALLWSEEAIVPDSRNKVDFQNKALNPEGKVLGPVDLEAIQLITQDHDVHLKGMGEQAAEMVQAAFWDYFDNEKFERFREGDEIPHRDVVRGNRHYDSNSKIGVGGWIVRTRFSTEDYPLVEEYFARIDEARKLRTDAVKAYIAALR